MENNSSQSSLSIDDCISSKRKKLKTVRVRNALRKKVDKLQEQVSCPKNQYQYSSTSDDSNDQDNVQRKVALGRKRRNTDLLQIKKEIRNAKVGRLVNSDDKVYSDYDEEDVFKNMPRLIPKPEQSDWQPNSIEDEEYENNITMPDLSSDKGDWINVSTKSSSNEDNLSALSTGPTYSCPICMKTKKISSAELLLHHLVTVHNLDKETDLNILKRFISHQKIGISSNGTNEPKYSRPFRLERLHFNTKKYEKSNKSSTKVSLAWLEETKKSATSTVFSVESKARSGGAFNCLKCGFTCNSEDNFCNHVRAEHVWTREEMKKLIEKGSDPEPTEFWCPECSSTFLTKAALGMHLKGTHDFLKDVELYLEKIGYEGEVPLYENQCDICFQCFEGPWELEKHSRGHGMAWLRRCATSQTLWKLRKIR